MKKSEDIKLLFTDEQLNLFLPELDHPISQDEYLSSLYIDNDGVDFGEVLDYDAEEEAHLMEFATSYYKSQNK